MACSEDVYFHLFLADVHDLGDLLIALPLKVSELHGTSLFLRQSVDEAAYQLELVLLHGLFLGIGCVTLVRGIVLPFFQTLVLVFHLPHLVERDVSADGEAEGFYRFDVIPLLPLVPDLDHRLLDNVFRLRRVESDAESEPVELILEWQDIIPETDLFHPLYIK